MRLDLLELIDWIYQLAKEDKPEGKKTLSATLVKEIIDKILKAKNGNLR